MAAHNHVFVSRIRDYLRLWMSVDVWQGLAAARFIYHVGQVLVMEYRA